MTVETKSEFNEIHTGSREGITRDELAVYIEKHAELWAMLSVNLNISEDECKMIATEVAFQMSCRIDKNALKKRKSIMDVSEFHNFRKAIIDNPQGQVSFFHRTVFAAFDKDNSGTLNSEELNNFLELFYQADSIFAGDFRLPEKEELKKIIYSKFDKNGDKLLTYDEMHDIISGRTQLSSVSANVGGEKK